MLKRITILFFISSFSISFGQGMFNMFANNTAINKSWQIGFGGDRVTFSEDDVDYIGGKNTTQIPRINVTKMISREFAIDLAFSINGFDDVIETNETSYFSTDISARYYLLANQDRFDPYLFTGFSLVNIRDIFSPTMNIGVGMTIWVTSNIGFNAQAIYKSGINKQILPSHSQICAGIIFGFNNDKKIEQSRCSFSRR